MIEGASKAHVAPPKKNQGLLKCSSKYSSFETAS